MFLDFSREAGHGLQVVYVCRNGQLVVDELTGDVRISARRSEYRELPTSRYAMPADIRTMVIEGADTIAPTVRVWSALLSGGSYPDGETGEHAIACLVAAHVSNENGTLVRIGELAEASELRFGWA